MVGKQQQAFNFISFFSENCPPENCPLTINFPPKTIAPPPQANSTQRALRVNLGKLCIAYEYYCLRLKNHSTKKYFSRRQFRIKKRFTSICLLQILTRPCRAPFTKCLLIFLRQNTKKILFLKKLIRKKIQKNFIVNK